MALHLPGRLLRGMRAGPRHSIWNLPQLQAPASIALRSSTFADGGGIPLRHAGAGVGANVSPQLSWSGLPAGTAQLLVAIEDTDVPLPRPLIHTLALIDGTGHGLAEGALNSSAANIRFVPASFGRLAYAGPRPVPGHGAHHYGFYIFALDRALPASGPASSLKAMLPALAGHVLARGKLVGTYERP